MSSLLNSLRYAGGAVLDFVYPPHCLACGRPVEDAGEYLCPACWDEILARPARRCPRCSCPLEPRAAEGAACSGPPCGPEARAGEARFASCASCASWEPVFERALVLGPFSGALERAVHALKFKHQETLGTELGRRMARATDLAGLLVEVDLLILVPLHPARLRERGYNQSLYIARGLSEVTGKPLLDRILKRRIHTRQQARLEARARQDNLRDAFEAVKELPEHRRVGVVDDVVTTAATLNACTRALQQAGARSVWGLALASPLRR